MPSTCQHGGSFSQSARRACEVVQNMELVWGVLIVFALGLTAGSIAQSKGKSFAVYFLLGALIPIVGVILAIALPPNREEIERRELAVGNQKTCPFCAELIRSEASVCRFCGRDLPVGQRASGVVFEEAWAAQLTPAVRKRVPAVGERIEMLFGKPLLETRDARAARVTWASQSSYVTVVRADQDWAWVQTDDGEEGWLEL